MKKNRNLMSALSYIYASILILITISVSSLLLSGCENSEDRRDSKLSLIYPPSLVIKDLKPITLISPNNTEVYYIDDRQSNDLVFQFDAAEPYYASVILFKDQPRVSKEGYIIDGNAQCLGGVTSMSSLHRWNGFSSIFSVDETKSVFYTCNDNATTDTFSESVKLSLDDINLPKDSQIYWAVLGYDKRYTLTHSSPLRQINIK